jgi:SAM-dependent methyltransferase
MPATYDRSFYDSAGAHTPQSAAEIIPLVLEYVTPRSVVDVGCGSGAWLAEFARRGVEDVLGLDGPWVAQSSLQIPRTRFRVVDLGRPIEESRRFDLVVCLEVAEHLPATQADTIVESLTRLGDVILFSAAIPFQGGTNHVNEQWPEYWAARFASRGFVFVDTLRSRIWTNPRVEWWYAQNMFFVVETAALSRLPALQQAATDTRTAQLSLVHPRAYVENVARAKGPSELFQATLGAIKRRLLKNR